jgi:glycerol-3-phosphate dehydrogenase (NAD(P)+)
LANLLAKKGYRVTLWAYEPELVAEMSRSRVNTLFLPGVTLSENLNFTNDLVATVRDKSLVLFVSPSQVMRSVVGSCLPHLSEDTLLVSASKGIELGTLQTVSQIMADLLPKATMQRFSVLSGPSFAREVAQEMPTAVVAAAAEITVATRVQSIFSTDYFRVYTNRDMVGVEIGGSLKNVIAIAAGISDGLGFGHNTRAALITRGLAEMTRLGRAMGADAATFAGLAGMGDLVLTCTGDLSRNRTVGMKLGGGQTLQEILAEMKMVAEGVKTAESAHELAQRHGVDMPLTTKIYQILHQGKPARTAVLELMSRGLKSEEI